MEEGRSEPGPYGAMIDGRTSFDERNFDGIVGLTLFIAPAVTPLTHVLGYPAAYALTLAPRCSRPP